MTGISFNLGTLLREGQMQKYYIFLNLGPAAGPVQANITDLQLPVIETRVEVLLELVRADGLRASWPGTVPQPWHGGTSSIIRTIIADKYFYSTFTVLGMKITFTRRLERCFRNYYTGAASIPVDEEEITDSLMKILKSCFQAFVEQNGNQTWRKTLTHFEN